jgi:holo-[acyl-carrier protein] synthase
MILGVGVDVVPVERVERILRSGHAEAFLNRVFSPEERAVCERSAIKAQCYAARFAAKEAVSKALGTGFSRGVAPASIVVIGGDRSRPLIELRGGAKSVARSLHAGFVHVSLTHTSSTAMAFAVLEAENR